MACSRLASSYPATLITSYGQLDINIVLQEYIMGIMTYIRVNLEWTRGGRAAKRKGLPGYFRSNTISPITCEFLTPFYGACCDMNDYIYLFHRVGRPF